MALIRSGMISDLLAKLSWATLSSLISYQVPHYLFLWMVMRPF